MHTYNGRNIEDFLNPNDANRTMAKHRVELGSVPIFIYQLPLRWYTNKERDFYFHDHIFSEIAIIEEGEGYHHIGNRSWHITAGDVLVLHPGVLHAYSNSTDFAIANVGYDIRRIAMPYLDGYDLLNFHAFFPQTP